MAKYDLTVDVNPGVDGVSVSMEYATDIFDEQTILRLGEMYGRLLVAAVEEEDASLGELTLLDEAEYELVTKAFNDTQVAYDKDKTVLDLIAEQVKQHPASIAVLDGERQLSYAELDAASNRLARHLIGLGVGPERVVGVCLQRSRELIVTLLGIWKAGGAYLPLDPDYPAGRLTFMLSDANAEVVITTAELADRVNTTAQTVLLDEHGTNQAIKAYDDKTIADAERLVPLSPDALAYIIYTSGSTGKPKAVLIPHANITTLLLATDQWYGFNEHDVWTGFHSYAFDFSVWEMWGALSSGGRLVIVPKDVAASPRYFVDLLKRYDVTVLNITPTVFGRVIGEVLASEAELPAIRSVIFGGEKFVASECEPWFARFGDQRPELVNMYGITETTVHVSYQPVMADQIAGGQSIIGGPIPSLQLYVVDDRLNVQPLGVAGELLVGGDQLARGYLGRPALTAEKFIADPFSGKAGARLYKTGDLVRWGRDGNLEFLGRIDQQVKIRGMRVELEEIEAALAQCEGVAQAVVAPGSAPGGGAGHAESSNHQLVAYVVPESQAVISDDSDVQVVDLEGADIVDLPGVRSQLKRTLPEHMVPSGYVGISRLPLTSSGKVDRKALPKADASTLRAEYIAPRTEEEQRVAEAFATVLNLDVKTVSLHDHFFDLGGHSLLAMRLVTQLEVATGRMLGVRTIFECPTVLELAQALVQAVTGVLERIDRVDRSQRLPLAFQQERLWFLDRLDESAGHAYHIEGVLRLRGELNAGALERALVEVVNRHEALRTHFEVSEDGEPVQVIGPPNGFVLGAEDVAGLDESGVKDRVEKLLAKRFDLEHGPLFRATLLTVSEEEYVLVIGGHHTVLDGWSVNLLLSEIGAFYGSQVSGKPLDLPGVPGVPGVPGAGVPGVPGVDYADYAVWQRQVFAETRMGEAIGWWQEELAGVPEAINLPTDRPRPRNGEIDYRGGSVGVLVPPQVTKKLKTLAQGEGATLFMVLEAAFALLLARTGGDRDLVVGTAVANRPRAELESLIGFFVNTVALRHKVDLNRPFAQLLQETRQTVLGAFEHQHVPFEEVVEAVTHSRSLSHTPLLQVMFVLQNMAELPFDSTLALEGVACEMFGVEDEAQGYAQFELTLSLQETDKGLTGGLSYASSLFDRQTAERLVKMYVRLLEAVAEDASAEVGELPLLDDAEYELVTKAFNDTQVAYDKDKTVLDLIAEQVKQHPESIAVLDGERQLSYAELDAASNQLARHLIGLGVGPERVVGVCLQRSRELIVTLLGIWKAGGAYLPLDPDYPAQRLTFMLSDANAEVVITTAELADRVNTTAQTVVLDEHGTNQAIKAYDDKTIADAERLVPLSPESLAYIIYTSGSTGKPKAVQIPHAQYTAYLSWAKLTTEKNADHIAPLHTNITFDVAMETIGVVLVSGYTLDLIRHTDSTAALIGRLQCIQYNQLNITPTQWELIKDLMPPDTSTVAPKQVVVGGEVLDSRLVSSWRRLWPSTLVINEYGPTEATIGCTRYHLNELDPLDNEIPIGTPVPNTQLYVVDERLNVQPVGVAGELLVGGDQLARGYLGRPALTAEKFIADPFSGKAGARLYKTGDLVRWGRDGNLEFLGRIDQQVKIRGMRVELEEIEAALAQCEGVAQAVVAPGSAPGGGAGHAESSNHQLVAYVVPESQAVISDDSDVQVVDLEGADIVDLPGVRSQLKRTLPEHMVPSGYVGISRLPLTSSGKVDRKALPKADASTLRAEYIAPRTEEEQRVAEAFATVLNLDVKTVSLHDHFFDLGGHSLLAMRLVTQLEVATGRMLGVRTIFECPTVLELAQALVQAVTGVLERIDRVDRSQRLPLAFQQERLWFLDRLDESAGHAYHIEGVLRLRGELNAGALERALVEVVNRHEALRTHFEVSEDGEPVQVIGPPNGFVLGAEDVAGLDESGVKDRVEKLLAKRFDLEHGPLFRATLLTVSEEEYVLVIGGHHTVLDGWSVNLLLSEIGAFYGSQVSGKPLDLPGVPGFRGFRGFRGRGLNFRGMRIMRCGSGKCLPKHGWVKRSAGGKKSWPGSLRRSTCQPIAPAHGMVRSITGADPLVCWCPRK